MNRRDGFYRFDLNYEFIFHEDIDSETYISQLYIIVDNRNRDFRLYIQTGFEQFIDQASSIRVFKQTWTKC